MGSRVDEAGGEESNCCAIRHEASAHRPNESAGAKVPRVGERLLCWGGLTISRLTVATRGVKLAVHATFTLTPLSADVVMAADSTMIAPGSRVHFNCGSTPLKGLFYQLGAGNTLFIPLPPFGSRYKHCIARLNQSL
jgi:hypothetical protein